jgi:putative toxin-antitoxin system antitoxin component (TIGR02293 family)
MSYLWGQMYKSNKIKNSVAEEVAVAYERVFDSRLELIQSIKRGISYKLFEYIKHRAPFSDKEWASFLDISEKSLQRYALAKNHTFKPSHAEKILEIAEVCDAGLEIFQDKDGFYTWLIEESIAFDNLKPIHFMDTSYGMQLIIHQLGRYAHGIFA